MSSLYLFPADPSATPPAILKVRRLLAEAGVLGKSLGGSSFLTGANFLQHITFAGCSPHVVLEPSADGGRDFCHISINDSGNEIRLFVAENRSKPRCPNCKNTVAGWKALLPQWLTEPGSQWACPECKDSFSAWQLDWRKYGVSGKLLIEIHGIYPGEALPGDRLMDKLKQSTGCDWGYGWAD